MLDGLFIDLVVGLVMSIAVATIVTVSIASSKNKKRLRDHRDAMESSLRYHRA